MRFKFCKFCTQKCVPETIRSSSVLVNTLCTYIFYSFLPVLFDMYFAFWQPDNMNKSTLSEAMLVVDAAITCVLLIYIYTVYSLNYYSYKSHLFLSLYFLFVHTLKGTHLFFLCALLLKWCRNCYSCIVFFLFSWSVPVFRFSRRAYNFLQSICTFPFYDFSYLFTAYVFLFALYIYFSYLFTAYVFLFTLVLFIPVYCLCFLANLGTFRFTTYFPL